MPAKWTSKQGRATRIRAVQPIHHEPETSPALVRSLRRCVWAGSASRRCVGFHGPVFRDTEITMRLSFGLEQKLRSETDPCAADDPVDGDSAAAGAGAGGANRARDERESDAGDCRRAIPMRRRKPVERENPDAPDREREGNRRRRKQGSTRTTSNAWWKWISEFPEAFDDGPRRSANRMEEMASRKHDAMANIAARAETLQHYLEMQLGELELDRRAAGDGRADRDQSRLQRLSRTAAWRICCRPMRAKTTRRWLAKRWKSSSRWSRPVWEPAICANV